MKPWFDTWLRNLVAYCTVMGVPIPRDFKTAFNLVPPPRQDTQS